MKYLSFIAAFAALIFFGCGKNNNSTIASSGTIEATDVTVSAQAGGIVLRLCVDEGSVVHAGDTLLIIDDVDWRFQYDQAAAGFVMAESQYQLAVKGSRVEDIMQSEANYRNAESDLKRIEELWQTKSVTEKQLDDARTRFYGCPANLGKNEARLAAGRNRSGSRTEGSVKSPDGFAPEKIRRLHCPIADQRNRYKTFCRSRRTCGIGHFAFPA